MNRIVNQSVSRSIRRAAIGGFTLIELLVVVAIIIALLAILLPSLNNAIAVSQQTACMSNMRQVTLAATSYTADHWGLFPPNRTSPNPAAYEHVTWRWILDKKQYLQTPDRRFTCPADPPSSFHTEQDSWIGSTLCIGDTAASNYAYNGGFFWRWTPSNAVGLGVVSISPLGIPNASVAASQKEVRFPSRLILFIETRDKFPDLSPQYMGWTLPWSDGYGPMGFWHTGGTSNWSRVDGSIVNTKAARTMDSHCWWHNIDESPDPHADWVAMAPEIYR